MTETFVAKIKARMLELMIVSGMSRSEATKTAAREYGREHIKIPKIKSPPPISGDEGNAREILFSKIAAIRQRMFPDANPNDDMTATLAERSKPNDAIIRRAIKRIKLAEDDDVKPADATPVPSSNYTEVYCGRS